MKKLLVILLAFALVFGLVLTGCPNGSTGGGKKPGGEEPTPPPPPGGADPIEVEFSDDSLHAWGGGTIKSTEDGTGFTFTYGGTSNNSHGNAVAMFKVNLGKNQVRDFEKVTFTFTGMSGDLGENTGQYDKGVEKGLTLLAAAKEDDMKSFGGNDSGIVDVMVNKFVGGTAGGPTINASGVKIGKDQPTKTAMPLEIEIDPTRPKSSLDGEVWFSIYLHASATSFTGSTANADDPTSFTITDFTFVPYEKPLGDLPVNELVITGVTAPVSGGTPVAAITNKNQYTGTVAWADAAGTAAGATFADATVYTATITLTVAEGFTFEGVAANAFTVAGAPTGTTVTNAANTGVVTAKFPATAEPSFGPQKDGSYTMDPAASFTADGSGWKAWYSSDITKAPAIAFTGGGADYMYPADFDPTDYAKVVFEYSSVVIDDEGNDGGAKTSFKGIHTNGTARLDVGYPGFTTGTNGGTVTLGPGATGFYQKDWDDFAGCPDGFTFAVNGNDTTDKFTITFESITFYP